MLPRPGRAICIFVQPTNPVQPCSVVPAFRIPEENSSHLSRNSTFRISRKALHFSFKSSTSSEKISGSYEDCKPNFSSALHQRSDVAIRYRIIAAMKFGSHTYLLRDIAPYQLKQSLSFSISGSKKRKYFCN